MKYVALKGRLEWNMVLDTLGFAVDNGHICDAAGKSPTCRECSAPVTVDNIGILFREKKEEDFESVFVCRDCHLTALFELVASDEEIDGVEFDSTDLDAFFAGFEEMMKKEGSRRES